MKKTLIAVALASTFVVSAQAEVKLSGTFEQAVTISTAKSGNDSTTTNAVTPNTTLYLNVSEDLGNGLKLSAVTGLTLGAAAVKADDTPPSLSLSGGFGKVTLGGIATGTKALASNTGNWVAQGVNVRDAALGVGKDVLGVNVRNGGSGVEYSTNFGNGITFAYAFIPGNAYDAAGKATVTKPYDTATGRAVVKDVTTPATKSSLMNNSGFKLAYSNAGISAGYASNSEKNSANAGKTDRSIITFGYTMGDIKVALGSANHKVGNGTGSAGDVKNSALYLDFAMTMGANVIHVAMGNGSTTSSGTKTDIKTDIMGFEFVHSMSKTTKAYFGYAAPTVKLKSANLKGTGTMISMGVQHAF